ncbi:hypothetical protein [Lentzea sp. NBRC 102530]|uniref:hypothetical protein n=1 Tax=Lentzea sp. NBRC 102530 TaxID=3032201 RepID=UPI0024A34025|nr:hypothetical protein [Lentzea sp. NBRC 102530]GLY50865.1 hypothetical protein Lesp01_45210 [Lentzea sp. NBRC 102530]
MRRLALFVLLCVTLAGCGVIGDVADLRARLIDAGYAGVAIYQTSTNGTDRVEVGATTQDGTKSNYDVAEIVWDSYPRHVDELRVMLNATVTQYTAEELRVKFGERGVTEKPDDDTDLGRTIITWLIVAAVVFLLFVVGVIVLIVFLVRRSRRRRVQQPPFYPPQYPHQ